MNQLWDSFVPGLNPYALPEIRLIPHGAHGDTRYPSPRAARRSIAFVIDIVVHFGIGLGAGFAVSTVATERTAFVVALVVWTAASILDRTVVQAMSGGATIGKFVTDIRMIRPEDGGPPQFRLLARMWFKGLYDAFDFFLSRRSNLELGDETGSKNPKYPCAVRTRDLKHEPVRWVRRRDRVDPLRI
ncbi:hypothetical protein DW322_07695 [Rhodococcus rhodnii]|uniref:RDD domain-containing protein n=2 Tax=Rhodococcus rhodnii TaxID=38312 RepID=R7WKX7_9NOCA|nr:RDD family protein [Rhodococcus rhodnii]EOM75966.1 hypothetical protein Rrhod_2720 [Rhodococcus rhodnii LMG 5362]TXG90123.1 hypothetical protein DW322_07695 [Rhodococcus rhodnii]